ncbi:PAS domain-containing sensor histidine kinase [Pedobacter cryophilus]|uniref:histidine kinase n=1 Tax=Pedobacter cryophilus TaxID=2571271 RepID=A0A4U1C415_9SPHI|nr:PAS domain-containing sensor histidine kinase [Pedobacter cryophilus]TKC00616.1 PAS domain-containing sensor histidine kinase [Pedobacter cryophilus]
MLSTAKDIDFRVLFKSTPGLLIVVSPQLLILTASDDYLETTNTKQSEIIGKYILEGFPNLPYDVNQKEVANALTSYSIVLQKKTKHTLLAQKYLVHNSYGILKEKYFNIKNKPVLNSENEVLYIITQLEDVTDAVCETNQYVLSDHPANEVDLLSFELHLNSTNLDLRDQNKELQQQLVDRYLQLDSINKNISDYIAAIDEASIVVVTDENDTIQLVNDNFCKISKYSREELIGKNHRFFNSGHHSKEFMRDLWLTIVSGNVWKGELKNKAKDGTTYWVDTIIVPFLNKEGKPYKYLSIRSDITLRKLDEAKLIASEEKYRNLFENSLIAILSSDLKTTKVIDVNQIGVKLFGYQSKKDFLKNFKPENHWVNISQRLYHIEILMKKGEVRNKIQEMKKLDGTHFWANISTKSDKEINSAQTVIIDITEQVQSHQNLISSEEKYRDLYENSLVSIFSFDTKTAKVIDVNNVGVQLLGYQSKKDFLDNYKSEAHWLDMPERERIIKSLIIEDGVKVIIHQMKRLDGTYFWARMNMKYNFKTFLLHSVIVDVSEQMRSRDELENKVTERTLELTRSLLREKELHEMKSSFVSMASHEFRTPLATILSSASIIEVYKDSNQQEKRLKHTKRISSSVKNLIYILNNFLSVGELEKGIWDIDASLINLPEFMQLLMEEMEGMLRDKNQQIIYTHEGELLIEQSNKTLKNIILNLLSNASKYSYDGENIYLSSVVANGRVTIAVKDQGIGIPQEDQKGLFTQFFRASNKEYIQGTGLGLYIVKKYLELINGDISFKSQLNEGTTFTISFAQKRNKKSKTHHLIKMKA